MKKFFLSLGVVCLTLSTFASKRVLYQQNFETATGVDETGWSFGGGSISIASDEFGKFLELNLGQNNGRTGMVNWNQEKNIFLDADGNSVLKNGKYQVKYDFSIQKGSNNQYNGSMTVFTNHTPVTNQPYRNPWSPLGNWENFLFDMSQDNVGKQPLVFAVNGEMEETTDENGNVTAYNVSMADSKTFAEGMWYTVTLDVDVTDRTVEYKVEDVSFDEIASGTRNVPETDANGDPISMYADGIFVMLARYQTIYLFDNIEVSYDSGEDWANPPTIALTGVGKDADDQLNLNMRTYTISFLEDETLHMTGTDGATVEVDYAECEGNYKYWTATSGELKAWTTCGTATSEVVLETVDTTPIVLPKVEATISSVAEGFAKTYTLSVNNSDVPLRPTIFINYEFKGDNGETFGEEGVASGAKVTVPGKGQLTLTSEAFGYESKTYTVNNIEQFDLKKVYDFARMTEDEVKAAGLPGFNEVLNSGSTSGFNNWTARKRLYYQLAGSEHENDEGETVVDNAFPFGFISEDNTTNVLNYGVLDRTETEEDNSSSFFEGLTIFPDKGKKGTGLPNVGMMQHIGLFNNETTNNNNNIIIHGLTEYDFVVVNYINNYGGNSVHPYVATDDEYYAVLGGEDAVFSAKANGTLAEDGTYDVTYALYRVDTACTKITIFSQNFDSVDEIAVEVAGDNYYYSIDGMRMVKPTRPGLYIHNGKKIIVK